MFVNACFYVEGLFAAQKSNCQQLAAIADSDCNQQKLHHLLSAAKWDHQALMDSIATEFVTLLDSYALTDDLQLIIDESGFAKKGHRSHGVARQYNGSLGKIDNCQVGVFAALNAGSLTSPVNARLYDPGCGVSKINHAEALIEHIICKLKLPVGYVSFDAFYGRDTALLASLKQKGIHFIADVPENLQVCLHPFQMRVPGPTSKRGPRPKNKKPTHDFISVKDYAATLKRKDFEQVSVRHSSHGKLKARYHHQEVYLLNPHTNTRMKLRLLIRKDADGTIKYSLCHAPEETPLKELAYQQSKRYFIERSFQDGKQQLGMDQYQSRSEQSWLRHMALCMLAMLFINQEKLQNLHEEGQYLSSENIAELITAAILFNEVQQLKAMERIIAKAPPAKTSGYKKIYLRI